MPQNQPSATGLLLQRSTGVQVRSSVRLMPQNQPSATGLLLQRSTAVQVRSSVRLMPQNQPSATGLLLQRSTAVQVRSSVRLMPQNQPSATGLLLQRSTAVQVKSSASLRTPCPSCRTSSQIGTLKSMTCLLLLPHFVDAMKSPYNGYHLIATCLAMRLLTLWQRRAQQKSKWVDPPATLR